MGHHINAIVTAQSAISSFTERFASPKPIELPFDLALIPLDEQRLNKLAVSLEPSFDGFTYLTPAIADQIGREIGTGRGLYIETDYFGGMGGQRAALFEDGALVWKRAESTINEPKRRSILQIIFPSKDDAKKSPINEGLANLGVVPKDDHDEFNTIGLDRFRSLEALGLDED